MKRLRNRLEDTWFSTYITGWGAGAGEAAVPFKDTWTPVKAPWEGEDHQMGDTHGEECLGWPEGTHQALLPCSWVSFTCSHDSKWGPDLGQCTLRWGRAAQDDPISTPVPSPSTCQAKSPVSAGTQGRTKVSGWAIQPSCQVMTLPRELGERRTISGPEQVGTRKGDRPGIRGDLCNGVDGGGASQAWGHWHFIGKSSDFGAQMFPPPHHHTHTEHSLTCSTGHTIGDM